MNFNITDIIGTIGVIGVLIAYFNLQTGRWHSQQLVFPLTNFISSFLILVSLWRTPNLPSIVIEVAWAAISAYGIWKISTTKK